MTAASVIAAVVLTATTVVASWLDGKGNKNHFASVSWFTYFMHLLVHVSGDSLATKHRKTHWEDDEVRANRHDATRHHMHHWEDEVVRTWRQCETKDHSELKPGGVSGHHSQERRESDGKVVHGAKLLTGLLHCCSSPRGDNGQAPPDSAFGTDGDQPLPNQRKPEGTTAAPPPQVR